MYPQRGAHNPSANAHRQHRNGRAPLRAHLSGHFSGFCGYAWPVRGL
jgi:hypothetical protein